MQGFAQASENPPAQEQWKTMKITMKKQCAEQSERSENPDERRRRARVAAN
jgi:hypothetical protein